MSHSRITAKHLHRQLSDTLKRVRQGERLIIEYYGIDVGAIVPMSDFHRLEGNVSEEKAEYNTGASSPDDTDMATLQSLALRLADGDPVAAAALLSATAANILKRLATEDA
jgi:antitoxin (DNA-binding transcriptional repressor) of toxin-antitoxin stability system